MWLKQYYVIGRQWPSEKKPEPELFFMKIFSPNESIAKSRFWYFLRKTQKIKKVKGEIVSVKKITEKKNKNVKNFGIWLRYDSKSGTINMYKEYRDVLVCGAVEQMYMEMAGRHRAKWSSIIILRIEQLSTKECIRQEIKQFHKNSLKFPISHFIFQPPWDTSLFPFKSYRPQTCLKEN
ncbi:rpl18A (nucleomorph) [Hemiselmis andersenii]|uniref:60S ribosomal protein L18a n=1 Tax=Hemiselmis andersenii TaxID=464988 RepID=A9BK76_HEMAN|nr:rpl18A [Hemiselmis andersenii]ABW97909.1 rpl18A [Hemiselmis andersenii]|mmetsp:Transcript_18826/g.43457  ORF Transcript_18826/g.43457 Transcript_18826/m.43457 type:complete len:179 (+) Transcript_18826:113-649(+)